MMYIDCDSAAAGTRSAGKVQSFARCLKLGKNYVSTDEWLARNDNVQLYYREQKFCEEFGHASNSEQLPDALTGVAQWVYNGDKRIPYRYQDPADFDHDLLAMGARNAKPKNSGENFGRVTGNALISHQLLKWINMNEEDEGAAHKWDAFANDNDENVNAYATSATRKIKCKVFGARAYAASSGDTGSKDNMRMANALYKRRSPGAGAVNRPCLVGEIVPMPPESDIITFCDESVDENSTFSVEHGGSDSPPPPPPSFTVAPARNWPKCNFCGAQLKNHREGIKHALHHRGVVPQICSICGEDCYGDDDLQLHMEQQHIGLTTFDCNKCQQHFSSLVALGKHKCSGRMRGRSFKCDRCDLEFEKKRKLRAHKMMHAAQKSDVPEPD